MEDIRRYIISVIGSDRPGIIARVSRALFELDLNIENVSQTILGSQFSGTFIVAGVSLLDTDGIRGNIRRMLEGMDLDVLAKEIVAPRVEKEPVSCEPFVITTIGPDRKGLVAGITEVIATYGANVTDLQAVFKGGENPKDNLMIYSVDIPCEIDQKALYTDLRKRARELGLEISIQHKNIFYAINRI